MDTDERTCKCYVRHLDAETQYVLHWGAHNPACPVYHRSLDPVDHLHDEDFRRAHDDQS